MSYSGSAVGFWEDLEGITAKIGILWSVTITPNKQATLPSQCKDAGEAQVGRIDHSKALSSGELRRTLGASIVRRAIVR